MPSRPLACAAVLLPLLACGSPPANAPVPRGQETPNTTPEEAPDDASARSGVSGPIRSGTVSPGTASTPPSIAFAPVDLDQFPLADRLAFGMRAAFKDRDLFVHYRFRGARSSDDLAVARTRTLTITHHGVATAYALYDGTELRGGNVAYATPVPFRLPDGQVMIEDVAFHVDLTGHVARGDTVTVRIPQVSGAVGEAVVRVE